MLYLPGKPLLSPGAFQWLLCKYLLLPKNRGYLCPTMQIHVPVFVLLTLSPAKSIDLRLWFPALRVPMAWCFWQLLRPYWSRNTALPRHNWIWVEPVFPQWTGSFLLYQTLLLHIFQGHLPNIRILLLCYHIRLSVQLLSVKQKVRFHGICYLPKQGILNHSR